jgi:hypothetical protein
LRPGDVEQITLTFYGHANIVSEARAVCEVEGGPSYEIMLKGESSLVDYKFDFLEIDYNKIVSSELVKRLHEKCRMRNYFDNTNFEFVLRYQQEVIGKLRVSLLLVLEERELVCSAFTEFSLGNTERGFYSFICLLSAIL